jgi:maltodextrin utilization protein YvdJ
MEKKENDVAFWVMMVILAYMLIACIICPIAIAGFSKQPYALPMMALALALPFVHFFIFAGMEIARKK